MVKLYLFLHLFTYPYTFSSLNIVYRIIVPLSEFHFGLQQPIARAFSLMCGWYVLVDIDNTCSTQSFCDILRILVTTTFSKPH